MSFTTQSAQTNDDELDHTNKPSRWDPSQMLGTAWRLRVRLVLYCTACATVALFSLVAAYILRPCHTESRLSFRLHFEGADRGEYPDKASFAPADIVSTSVLEEVYRRTPVSKYVTFENFQASFSVVKSGPSIERLQREYQERLASRTLSQIDRQRIEQEFTRRLEEIGRAEFTLVGHLGERLQRWPINLSAKVLTDILTVWSEQARVHGILGFDVNVLSSTALAQYDKQDEPLLILNRLRTNADEIIRDIDALMEVPGARLIRAGQRFVSLAELKAQILDLKQFELGPAEALVVDFKLINNDVLIRSFLSEQIAQLSAMAQNTRGRMDFRSHAQNVYLRQSISHGSPAVATPPSSSSLIAQLSDEFLERMMEMSRRQSDIGFRQDLSNRIQESGERLFHLESHRMHYEHLLDSLNARGTDMEPAENARQRVQNYTEDVMGRFSNVIKDLQTIQVSIAEAKLQPSLAYTIIDPTRSETVSPWPIKQLATATAAIWLALSIVGTFLMVWRERERGVPPDSIVTTG